MPTLLLSKWVWIGAFVVVLIGAVKGYGQSQYEAGEAHQLLQTIAESSKAAKATAAAYEARLNSALSLRDQEMADTLKLMESLRNRNPKVVYREIEKVVEASDCTHLGGEFVSLFNRTHTWSGAARGVGSDSGRGDSGVGVERTRGLPITPSAPGADD